MPRYRVRYYRKETSSVRYEMEVEADSPEAARSRVADGQTGKLQFTPEEEESQGSGKEEVMDSEFFELEDINNPYAVVELEKY